MSAPFADDRSTWARVWSRITGAGRSDWIACLCVVVTFVVLLERAS